MVKTKKDSLKKIREDYQGTTGFYTFEHNVETILDEARLAGYRDATFGETKPGRLKSVRRRYVGKISGDPSLKSTMDIILARAYLVGYNNAQEDG